MEASKIISQIDTWVRVNGDKEVYILSQIDGKGTHVGKITELGIDSNGDIVIGTDIESVSSTV